MFLERKDLTQELKVEKCSVGESGRTTSHVGWVMEGHTETVGHPEKNVYKESRKGNVFPI